MHWMNEVGGQGRRSDPGSRHAWLPVVLAAAGWAGSFGLAAATEPAGGALDQATLLRRQEEMDLRRLRQAEDLLHRVRSAASQSRSEALHRQFDRMQDNLLRVRRQLEPSLAGRDPSDPAPKISPQVRPLLDETIQEGSSALAMFDAERRIGRDLDQTKGRMQRARKLVENTRTSEARSLLERADEQVRQSEEASSRGNYVQARVLMTSAERSLNRAIELDQRGSQHVAADDATRTGPRLPAGSPGKAAEARRNLDRIESSFSAASRHLGNSPDPVTARLLLLSESNLERARTFYQQGQPERCLSLLKLVGRLLERAYSREAAGS